MKFHDSKIFAIYLMSFFSWLHTRIWDTFQALLLFQKVMYMQIMMCGQRGKGDHEITALFIRCQVYCVIRVSNVFYRLDLLIICSLLHISFIRHACLWISFYVLCKTLISWFSSVPMFLQSALVYKIHIYILYIYIFGLQNRLSQ